MFPNAVLAVVFTLFTFAAPTADCPDGRCPVQPKKRGGLFERFDRTPRPQSEQHANDPAFTSVSVMIPGISSGVVVHVEGGRALVLTAQHCIVDGKFDGEVAVRFITGKTVTGHVVRVQNSGDDLAAILIPADESTVAIGVAKLSPPIGATVTQCGYTGAKPGHGPYQRVGSVEKYDGPFCYLSLHVDGGDSGSGVYDSDKKLCGIVVRKQSTKGAGKCLAYEHARLTRFYAQCVAELFPKAVVEPAFPKAEVAPAPAPVPRPNEVPVMTAEELRKIVGSDETQKAIEQLVTLVTLLLGGGAAGGAVPVILCLVRLFAKYRSQGEQQVRRRRRRKVAEAEARPE